MANLTKVFISYARADGAAVASALEAELESGGFGVWRDVRDIDGFNDFSVEIERAIADSDVVVVCITGSIAEADRSFVRREINYAESKSKPIVPIRIGNAPVPILVSHLTWIDAPSAASLAGSVAPELWRRLALRRREAPVSPTTDPMVTFTRALLDDIVRILEATTVVLLDIAAIGSSSLVPSGGGLPSSMHNLYRPTQMTSASPGIIGQDLSENHQRIILHGGPGSGKRTALLVAAREAANAWLEDRSRRLPVFCRARDWNARDGEHLLSWLDRSTPVLPKAELERALDEGRVALFVDGIDELSTWVSRTETETGFDPRKELIGMLPPQVSVLATSRSDALESTGLPSRYESVELEPITDDQISHYVSNAPDLRALFAQDQSLREIVQTPLTLGLLTYIAAQRRLGTHTDTGTEKLNPRLRLVYHFTASRWQHESQRVQDLLPLELLTQVLGRLAAWGEDFDEDALAKGANADAVDSAQVARTALQLGLVSTTDDRTFTFFHPSFADCYATLHCWRYLGKEESDGYDERLFQRIARLDDQAFVEPLTLMARAPFWRGEFGDDIAVTLEAIGGPSNAQVVGALLHLAGYHGVRLQGLHAVGRFARRCSDDVKLQFIQQLRLRADDHHEAVHQLVGLGDLGITALIEVYHSLDKSDPMRDQIASYSRVRDRLGPD